LVTSAKIEKQIKKIEISDAREARYLEAAKDLLIAIAPGVTFAGLWIGIDWLTNHKNPKTNDWYFTPASGELLVAALSAGFIANSFGGSGIIDIIKAFKG
jgi:hypothetical protein